ncbi:hypothetical protein FEM33_15120 [Dyadobacter flavalbus]|uniref:Signal transduction histidine kinase internal region domain-containing protein n=1 Tax=Dyadobacter flavalbus TaxID=2579942 RepID=A0A5M8QV18_9BACT|nr:histidine kinase [Dyadobacter flavalbus]KAA6438900.1 hypothetical protein FEM33_15120 [Dyadobacter flavalbus]
MNSINQSESLTEKLLFPATPGRRVLYHISFWLLYILLHYAYAIPTLAQKASDSSVTFAGFLYFLKIVPEYYLCIGLYNIISKYVNGILLFIVLVIAAILLNYFSSKAVFLLVDEVFELKNMPPRFQMFASLYLSPFRFRELSSWLVFVNDLSEVQFFILPIALKMTKFAVRENMMRQKLQTDALSMELKVLKSQINPHFVFNVLNAAYAKILPISEDAAEYLQKASEILRFSLYETNDEFIKLEKELSYLNQYVELESIRSNRRCKIRMVQQGNVKEEYKIPTLLLITLVENAFKHGVHATRHNSYVDIQISIADDLLVFLILNSKPNQPAMRSKNVRSIGGIGLANLKKRMEIYYKSNSKFDKTETETEFKVSIELPLL